MKLGHIIISSMLFFALTMTAACGNQDKGADQKETTEQATETAEQGKEYTSAYVCPMHCEGSGSDEAGTCITFLPFFSVLKKKYSSLLPIYLDFSFIYSTASFRTPLSCSVSSTAHFPTPCSLVSHLSVFKQLNFTAHFLKNRHFVA